MIVDPYKRTPKPPTVALLTREGQIVQENGKVINPDLWPDDTRAWCDYDTARKLVNDGYGESLCWNGEEIRWRHQRFEADWRNRRSDVAVLRMPFPADDQETLRALTRWRDWLASYGASPTGTSGSAAWSLLRATLEDTLFCSFGEPPPLLQTMGGRVQLGPAGVGSFRGKLAQVDMSAAYATGLSALRYGGRWFTGDSLPAERDPDWWAGEGRPVFVRAKLVIPEATFGPLIRRPRKRMSQLALFFEQVYRDRYPTGCTLQGVWTWPEIQAATIHGAKLLKVEQTWVHLAARQPFLPWWAAIQDGRAMPGLAGVLAKTTGNALWGRFCMEPLLQGRRSIRSKNGKVSSREFARPGGLPPAHDLAETVSGRVRAELYDLMLRADDGLLSAHTDGAWIREPLELQGSWRRKQPARRLDLLDPQTLRYWPTPATPWSPVTVFAGVPSLQADDMFDRAWAKAFEATAA